MIKMRMRACVDMGVAPGSVSPRYGRGRTQALEPAGQLPAIDALPLTGQYTTYSVRKGTDDPDYAATEQLICTGADVTLGGGAATFAETRRPARTKGRTLVDQADDLGYRIVNTKADLLASAQPPRTSRCSDCSRPATCRSATPAPPPP